ncbi:MAG: hypothetical protein ACJ76L_04510 [Conexibacter sp.]
MPADAIRPAHRKRWQRQIVDVLAKLPREYRALENAMAAFGESFDLASFKRAFESDDDLDGYNRAQAVERAVGRVQNFLTELADAGALLAALPVPEPRHRSRAEVAFTALRTEGVIDGRLCAQLFKAQRARSRIEHAYLDLTAGEVHRAARLVHDTAPGFMRAYRAWIEPFLPA